MLDIKFIRENKDLILEAARKKRIKFDVDKLITLDDKRREVLARVEERRREQNEFSLKIAAERNSALKLEWIEKMKTLKESLQEEENELRELMKEWQALMLQVPNIPDVSVPEGDGEKDNVELKIWGEKPTFNFPIKDHVELMTFLDMVDFERGIKAHGFRGYFLLNTGADLSWAVWNYARDFFSVNGAQHVITPAIVRKEHFYGTGHLPNEAEDLFKTQDDEFLSGTAEVPMMAFYADEVLKKEELPKKFLAFSPCYRREAGSHGKDIKGLIRVHEFYKLEQLVLCEAKHEESERLHEELTRRTEEFIESLGLPYRRLVICGGDLSASKVKQYEIELWLPSQKAYREIASSSYYHDFQTRRFNIKYDDNGKKSYAHSLNNTAIPTPRILVALVENNQTASGSVKIPKALVPYLNGCTEITKN
ncbi:serine--tRNA ligase [Patescibacteria group bacterium]|nr:MAG: serine--tRNA ligase [Patescibacteria group bacterium]